MTDPTVEDGQTDLGSGSLELTPHDAPHGPGVTRLLRRAAVLWLMTYLAGVAPVLFDASAGWKAAGLGLVFPGAGFLYTSDPVFFVLAVALFAVSLVLWFAMGNVVAPIAVWLGSAGLAAARAGSGPWTWPEWLVPAAVLLMVVGGWAATLVGWRAALRRGARRNTYLAEVTTKAGRTTSETRELSEGDLESARYLLDRALQPLEDFDGFDFVDQFQTAAVRYQLNLSQYALATVQLASTPAFDGYLSEGQRRLIEKMQDRRVWGYWRHENLWGNLRLDADPIARDNIMFSAYLGLMVSGYESNTGDHRYSEAGALRFRLDDRHDFSYDQGSIADAVRRNFEGAPLGMYPCEPNWVYSSCNSVGMAFLAGHAHVHGSDHFEATIDRFRRAMGKEFVTADGRVTAIRSSRLGLTIPSLTSLLADLSLSIFLSPTLPAHALRLWTIARTDFVSSTDDGRLELTLRGWDKIDVGNYRRGAVTPYLVLATAAKEMGVADLFDATMSDIDRLFDPVVEDGVRRYRRISNQAHAFLAWARANRLGGFRSLVIEGPPTRTLDGPRLADVRYPDVLVGHAVTDGHDLRLVLRPGDGAKRERMWFAGLQPRATYRVDGATVDEVTADGDGRAVAEVDLESRTEVRLLPA